MMGSAFDGCNSDDADLIRRRLMAGDSMASIRRDFFPGAGEQVSTISAKSMRDMRDEVFDPLLADPEKVKALAAGACINPLSLNHPRASVDRHTRMARAAARPTQIEMF